MADEIIKNVALQFPAIAILLVFTITLYKDMRSDAIVAQKQREENISVLLSMKEEISKLADKLSAHE